MTKRAKLKQLAERCMSNAYSAADFSDDPYFIKIPRDYIDELYELAFGQKALLEAKVVRLEAKVVRLENRQNYTNHRIRGIEADMDACIKKGNKK